MSHAPQPVLCKRCEAELMQRLQDSPQTSGFAFCWHHSVLAVFRIKDGTLMHWFNQGPLSPDEATRVLQRYLRDATLVSSVASGLH